ncbi:MAG: response regulator transcription factor [bacterium]
MRILYAEDEIKINKIITASLEKDLYTVDSCFDGVEALDLFRINEYDLVILDLMMPKKDGLEVIKEIRNTNKKIPILALTAKSELDDKVSGLDIGFDDYLTKPFKTEELKARIRALLRRSTTHDVVLVCNNLILDPKSKRVKRNDKEVELTAREYALLEYMMRNPNSYRTEQDIIDNVWDREYEGFSNVVAVHIKNIKKKIEKDFKQSELIVSERNKGYKIICDEEK